MVVLVSVMATAAIGTALLSQQASASVGKGCSSIATNLAKDDGTHGAGDFASQLAKDDGGLHADVVKYCQ